VTDLLVDTRVRSESRVEVTAWPELTGSLEFVIFTDLIQAFDDALYIVGKALYLKDREDLLSYSEPAAGRDPQFEASVRRVRELEKQISSELKRTALYAGADIRLVRQPPFVS
jgi:hypothetical protein